MAPKGLVTILIESQGADQAALESFLAERFPDNQAMACVSQSTTLPSGSGLPSAALVGIEGELLWSGNPIRDEKKIEELITVELQKRHAGFGETKAEVDVRRQIYGAQDYDKALSAIDDVEDQELRTKLQAELESVVARRLAGVASMQKNGRWMAAKDEAKAIARAVGRAEPWKDKADELEDSFKDKQAKAEITAEKRVIQTLTALRDQKDMPPQALAKVLKGLMSKIEGTTQESVVRRFAASRSVDL